MGGGWVSLSSSRVRQQTFAEASPLAVCGGCRGEREWRDDGVTCLRGWGSREWRFYDERVGRPRWRKHGFLLCRAVHSDGGCYTATTRIISSFKYRPRPRLTAPHRQLKKFKTPVTRYPWWSLRMRTRGRTTVKYICIYIYILVCGGISTEKMCPVVTPQI